MIAGESVEVIMITPGPFNVTPQPAAKPAKSIKQIKQNF
jgi:hypothetical protein